MKKDKVRVNKKNKSNIIIVCLVVFIFVFSFFIHPVFIETPNSEELMSKNISNHRFRNQNFSVIKKDYEGEYNIQHKVFDKNDTSYKEFNVERVYDYRKYEDFCNKFNIDVVYKDTGKNYIVYAYYKENASMINVRVADIVIKKDKAKIYVLNDEVSDSNKNSAYVFTSPVDKNIKTLLSNTRLITNEKYEEILNSEEPINGID